MQRSIHQLLTEIGPGESITRSAYDTAWVARLGELGSPLGEEALEWLRTNQLPDGSWGTSELQYHHDRLVCTLAAMTTLARRGCSQDRSRIRRAQLALEAATKGLRTDPAGETVGFEMIVPTLVDEAIALGIIQKQGGSPLEQLARYRMAKLTALRGRKITRQVTLAFSAEMVGQDGLDLLDEDNLQEANGSVGCSPAATAFFAMNARRQYPVALSYLKRYALEGAVPYVVPIDVFEHAWPLWNLALDGVPDNETMNLCSSHLDFLESAWSSNVGIASVACLAFTDGDATSMTHDVLTFFGRSVDLKGVFHYEEKDLFRCYALEANPSVSTNVHVLSALRQAGLTTEHPSVQKVLHFLRRVQTAGMFWFDKWHTSPYYPTAHAVIACAGYADELIDDVIYWILATQRKNGSWGYYLPTAEETTYCLQALSYWKRQGRRVPDGVLERGRNWLAEHSEPPYPPLWIGKSLYCPELVVRSAVLSALSLTTQV